MDGSRAINRVFSDRVLDDLMNLGGNEIFDFVVHNCVRHPEGKTYAEIFTEIYQHLYHDQRNEYFYQNTILLKLFLAKHSTAHTVAFRQLRIANSIADFVMINGEGRVYEIKSDLDNFSRLESQLRDYYSAFSKVSVVVPFRTKSRTMDILSKMQQFAEHVGVYLLTPRGAISMSESRDPTEFTTLLTHEALFKLLRKAEYERVVKTEFGELPDVKPVYMFRACLSMFKSIDLVRAQGMVMAELKTRNSCRPEILKYVPDGLKSVLYFSKKHYDARLLKKTLSTDYQGGSECTTRI